MRLVLILLWLAFIVSAGWWLPGYEGDLYRPDSVVFIPAYVVIAGVAALAVRERAGSARDAVMSILPALAILAGTAVLGIVMNEQRDVYRGGPGYLWFGVAVWGSGAALILSTAALSRTKWNGPAGIAVATLDAVAGWVLFIARID